MWLAGVCGRSGDCASGTVDEDAICGFVEARATSIVDSPCVTFCVDARSVASTVVGPDVDNVDDLDKWSEEISDVEVLERSGVSNVLASRFSNKAKIAGRSSLVEGDSTSTDVKELDVIVEGDGDATEVEFANVLTAVDDASLLCLRCLCLSARIDSDHLLAIRST